tara:strand:+ start:12988 stop:13338 length:351 start_codon:yes stop_codon:yes gene_type:complete
MRNLFFILVFFSFSFLASGQSQPQVGDEFIIKKPNAQTYKYVKFPRLNILIKRGKVGNYKSVYGNKVVVDNIISKDNGTTYVILKKKDDSKFFGFLNNVKANYSKSLEVGEIAVSK